MNVYVTALVEAQITIDVPSNPTCKQVEDAVREQIENGNFITKGLPELRYIEDSATETIYYDA